tara:strand:+ start:316 stop:597 length:282 start_codon:yes stop_codon:yes gene_type:complete
MQAEEAMKMEALDINDVLDRRFVFDVSGTLVEIQTMTTCGGPTVWVHYELGRDYATVHYSHSGGVVTVEAYLPMTTEYMFEVFEGQGMSMVYN